MERGNSMSYNPPKESSPLKLPLAPIDSTPPDRRGNATVSTRRGISIFSPTITLENHQQQQQSRVQKEATTSDPDPTQTVTPSNTKNPAPPPETALAAISSTPNVTYKECLKNHGAGMGTHVLDGCGEFMPGGPPGTPESLKCDACDCHRNFHRKEIGQVYSHQTPVLNNSHSFSHGPTPPTMVNFGGGGAVESSSEDLNMFGSGSGGHAVMGPGPSNSGSRKRFRSKFSKEQKDRMHDFAEKMEWRMQKRNEKEVKQFCSEIGVKRQVFKVWMHNNKHAMKKKEI